MNLVDIPLRYRVDLYVPAQLAIREAMLAVEKMPDDSRLTDAVILLGKAFECVADFVDNVPRKEDRAMNMLELLRRNADNRVIAHDLVDAVKDLKKIAETLEKWLAGDRVLIDALIGDAEDHKP